MNTNIPTIPSLGNLIVSFGKYKGCSLKDVPAAYLLWCNIQYWFQDSRFTLYRQYIAINKVDLTKTVIKERKEQNKPLILEDLDEPPQHEKNLLVEDERMLEL